MRLLKKVLLLVWLGCLSLGTPALSQQRVGLNQSYERILAVVPMVGAGTYEDPRRPKYAPTGPLHLPQAATSEDAKPNSEAIEPVRKGILGFSFVTRNSHSCNLWGQVKPTSKRFSLIRT
jgi:hypothetical protein